ncbi:Fe-S cluster assembly protein SufD [Thauera linaloolentis]|uniref:FeS assembly protein SufD n=1 Tax=Thauera linaloolentis (strain DSM 12138 / JCM 21573 / CCUG 41526 / CIP 105981 / IAM 15112 / NBRC 102519 / 47Lol) TaxID=1123367 RepID=N6ZCQ2_THAL4|nr:Fe-S cluster assembly protein SufD [Thauera linaloolentis]ENO89944.1 FeS assembly protein SufD [Thauera linaloolentis 47Lol = DSM 12138]MCM8566629.1 Fe-S cluster assembly protein SufD [Thauera linaloolentis]
MNAIDTWVARHRERAATLPGAAVPWLATRRHDAIERFAALGWPTSRLEAWRHTSLAFLEQHELAAPEAAPHPATTLAALRTGFDDGDHWLVFVDGRAEPALSVMAAVPAGVTICALSEALAHRPEAVETAFGTARDAAAPHALNLALCSDGAFVHLARGTALEHPLHLVFIGATGAADTHVRNLIVAEAGSEASIVEHHLGGGATLGTVVTRVQAAQDARVTHVKLQRQDERAIHLAQIEASQARGAHVASHSLSFGARLARNDIHTRFDGEGCEALLNGLYHVDGRRHVDHHTLIEHAHPLGTSREHYRGLVDGNARGVFAGRIIVAQDAQRTDAIQRCDNLLLSKLAEADARPELEIYADDVKCAHGATVGQIDEDALFYLRTRGVDETHARQLLTYAFAAEVIERIAQDSLRRHARATLLARLPGSALLEELL